MVSESQLEIFAKMIVGIGMLCISGCAYNYPGSSQYTYNSGYPSGYNGGSYYPSPMSILQQQNAWRQRYGGYGGYGGGYYPYGGGYSSPYGYGGNGFYGGFQFGGRIR